MTRDKSTVFIAVLTIASILFFASFALAEQKTVRSALTEEIIDLVKSESLYAPFSEKDLNALKQCMDKSSEDDFVKACFTKDKYARYIWPAKFKKIFSSSEKVVFGEVLPDKVGYLKITNFIDGNKILKDTDRFLITFEKKGIHKVILDLRGNPGGSEDTAEEFLQNYFSPGRSYIILTEYRGERVTPTIHITYAKGKYANWKLVVLVDHNSVSAAEMIAGVLQSWDSMIIGETTHGKGTITNTYTLNDSGVLMISVARYLLPFNVDIEGKGITPDIIESDSSLQLRKAIEILNK